MKVSQLIFLIIVSLGKINTIDKFRQFKNTSGFHSKKFNSIRKHNPKINSTIKKNEKKAISKQPIKKKKIKKKKLKKIKDKELENSIKQKEVSLNETESIINLDISEHLSKKEELVLPFSKFEEGKPVIKYLFEDSKDVSDQEMFHFLLLTNQFFNKNLNK